MRARALCLITLTCLAWVLAGCYLLPQSTSKQLLGQVEQEEQKWLEKDIEDYRIVVSRISSVWHVQTHEITVRNGVVVEQSASCTPAPAELGEYEVQLFDAAEYTVPGLFTVARALAEHEDGNWTLIEFDHPEIVDEDSCWGLRSFEILD
jgi:hypothetical protein